MNPARRHRPIARTNRRLAAALMLIGLFMQAIASYLPMPAMSGLTSWDMTWLAICSSSPGDDAGGGSNGGVPHPGECAACLVAQQATTTLAPDLIDLAVPVAALRIWQPVWQQAQRAAPIPEGFSSRAPPLLG